MLLSRNGDCFIMLGRGAHCLEYLCIICEHYFCALRAQQYAGVLFAVHRDKQNNQCAQ